MPISPLVQVIVAPLYIGLVFATLLDVAILQVWYYYTHQNDKWPLKSLVAAVIVCNTIHQAMITHTVYMYGVMYWGNTADLIKLVWTLVIQTQFGGFTIFLVQSFMVMRLWRLSNHNIFLLIFTSMIVLSQFLSAFSFSIAAVQRQTLEQLIALRPWSCAFITLAAVGDVIIAGALCYLLHRSRTGWERSDTVINKLIAFTISTGLVTSLYAVASFIAYLGSPGSTLYVGFYFSISRLYTNALLATLNARKTIHDSVRDNTHNIDTEMTGKVDLSLQSLSSPQSRTPNVLYSIDTTRETVTELVHAQEQAHRDDKEKISHLQPSSSSLALNRVKKRGDL